MKKIIRLLVVVVVCLGICGCKKESSLKEGEIYEMEIKKECTVFHPVIIYNGKTTTTVFIPYHYPQRFLIKYRRYFLWCHSWNDLEMFFGIAVTLIFSILFLVFIALAICNPISAKREYREFVETKVIIEQVVESGDIYDNIGLSQSVIEANRWLAKAKAKKKSYGCFSKYYKLDLDNIEPIKIPKKEE